MGHILKILNSQRNNKMEYACCYLEGMLETWVLQVKDWKCGRESTAAVCSCWCSVDALGYSVCLVLYAWKCHSHSHDFEHPSLFFMFAGNKVFRKSEALNFTVLCGLFVYLFIYFQNGWLFTVERS